MRRKKSAAAWWPRPASCGTGPWPISRHAGVPCTSSSRSSEPGRTLCCVSWTPSPSSVEELRERLASAEDEARVAAEEAGERVAQEPGHGDLEELEEELAAGAPGWRGGCSGKDEVDSSGLASGLEASRQQLRGDPRGESRSAEGDRSQAGLGGEPPERRRALRPHPCQPGGGGGCGGRRRGDAVRAPPPMPTARPAPSGESEARRGIYDIEAVTAAEADGAISAERSSSGRAGRARAPEAPAMAAMPASRAWTSTRSRRSRRAEAGVAADERRLRGLEPRPSRGASAAGAEGGADAGVEAAPRPSPPRSRGRRIERTSPRRRVAAQIVAAEAALEADAITEPDVEALARRDHLLGPVTAKLGPGAEAGAPGRPERAPQRLAPDLRQAGARRAGPAERPARAVRRRGRASSSPRRSRPVPPSSWPATPSRGRL